MKFYDCQTAPSPRRVRMFIAEKGLDIETVEVDMRAGEQMGEAYRAINPNCTVPALVLDDGSALLYTAGIRAYLEAIHPEPALLGRTPEDKGRVADAVFLSSFRRHRRFSRCAAGAFSGRSGVVGS